MGACQGRAIPCRAPYSEDPGLCVTYEGPGPWFGCLPSDVMPERFAPSGPGSKEEAPCRTIPAMLMDVANGPAADRDLLLVERPIPPLDAEGQAPPPLRREEWTKWSLKEAVTDSRTVAKAFISIGMKAFDTVNIWGFNAPEWHLSMYGATFIGAKGAGLYPTDTPEMAAYKVMHSGGVVVVVDDRAKVTKLAKAMSDSGDPKRVKTFVVYGGFVPAPDDAVEITGYGRVPVMSWAAILRSGAELPDGDGEVDSRMAQVQAGQCAVLIYTSGTTGYPKAVMLSHDNIGWIASCMKSILRARVGFATKGQERVLSYLPLSHVAGMMIDMISPLSAGDSPDGMAVFFARPYDLKAGSLKDRLQIARPTFFMGVPLVWEKLADKIRAIGASVTGMKKSLGTWAKGLALSYAKNCSLGGSGAAPAGLALATAVLAKVKAGLGLHECKFGATGAAPIRVDTLEYFGSLAMSINELYGMSETAGIMTMSTPDAHQWGSCGWALPGVEIKAFTVDPTNINRKVEVPLAPGLDATDEMYQGELCARGRNIMMGYLANPDFGDAHVAELRRKTEEAIDEEGWVHTGDKGLITEVGMVKITGRFKELIIGEGGENIAPVPIEDALKRACDGVAEVMMVGDKRKYNVALITLKAVGANGEFAGTDQLDAGARNVNPSITTISGAMDDKTWIQLIKDAVKAVNSNGKVCPNNAFKIQKFTILPTNFSEENNELTPTKKLKRKAVEMAYKSVIDKLYATEGTYIRYCALAQANSLRLNT